MRKFVLGFVGVSALFVGVCAQDAGSKSGTGNWYGNSTAIIGCTLYSPDYDGEVYLPYCGAL